MKPQYGEEFLRKDSFFSIKPEILGINIYNCHNLM